LRYFTIVGLADKAIEESQERIGSAIKSSGFKSPHSQPERVLASLAPADLKKEGALYDLPIALGYLISSKQISVSTESKLFAGELGLDGQLKPIRNALSLALFAKEKGWQELIIPKKSCLEASLIFTKDEVPKIRIIGANSLKEVINYLQGKIAIAPAQRVSFDFQKPLPIGTEMDWIKGQESSKRALEIAAAGGHNVLMQGPPGSGKSLLARSLPSILPSLNFEEILEVTKIYSAAGFLSEERPIINFRPFRSPHHTASEVALIGGGNPPKPGEITLAHRGVLFLDEFPEFHRDVLESLRQPLEEGKINILRAKHNLNFPCRFILIAAANPCPCGYYKNPERECHCLSSQIQKYRRKLSGPLIDRFDLFIDVPQLKFEKIAGPDIEGQAQKIKSKVENARQIQKQRFSNNTSLEEPTTNSEMQIPQIKQYCQIDDQSKDILRRFVDSGKLSGRGYHRVLKVARTIADLDNAENIKYEHLTEALMYRIKED